MKQLLMLLSLFIAMGTFAQKKTKIPCKVKKSPELLAHYLCKDLDSEQDKIDTLYHWVTHNIAYNYKKITSNKPIEAETAQTTLKSKKGICTDYVILLRAMLAEVGIESELVSGYIPSELTDTIVIPTYDSHAWLAIKTGGQWYLTDPTWDAGYIGSIRTDKIEVYKKKWKKHKEKYHKKDSVLTAKRDAAIKTAKKDRLIVRIGKNLEKKQKAEEKLQRKELNAKDFTGKTGFVFDPGKKNYMVHPDTFLLTHLPVNPMWQLKKDTISCGTFAYGEDSIKSYVSTINTGKFPFEKHIKSYQNKDILERMLWTAEDAMLYNPKNNSIKALNYYNYVNIITNKKVQEVVPDKYRIYDFSTLLPYVDTANTYAKKAIKSEKTRNKFSKFYFKRLYKEDQVTEKRFRKAFKNGAKYNEKTIKSISKRINSLRRETHSLNKKLSKIQEGNINSTSPEFNIYTQFLKDSVEHMQTRFEEKREIWKKATASSASKSAISCVLNNRYFISVVNQYMAFKDYRVNTYIDEIVYLIDSCNIKIFEIYKDSLAVEILKKETSEDVKQMASFLSFAKTELNRLQNEEKISNSETILSYLNYRVANNYDSLIQVNQEAIEHNILLKHTLNKLTPYWEDTEEAEEEFQDMVYERYQFALDDMGYENERQKTVYEDIIENTTWWKIDFKNKK